MRKFIEDYFNFVSEHFWWYLLFCALTAFFAGLIRGFFGGM